MPFASMFEDILTLKLLTTNIIDVYVVDGCFLPITKKISPYQKERKGVLSYRKGC